MPPEIHQLSPSVINKIAAGEVIERPASVVKELLENSVDAGATRIDLSVGKGGTELIRVADNGCGIAADQFHLAVASHATSKIQDADDLFHVDSFGFRGEALASIAEISRLLLRSRPAETDAGMELEVNGGQASELAPCGCPCGTTIEVRDLFFNTPVRRKFMRTTQTEMGHVAEAFTRIALAHPSIHFTLRHNDRVLHDLPAVDSWRQRIDAFFSGELSDALLPVSSEDGDVRVSGYVAAPTQSRGNNRMQYLFLNDRYIRDRSLQHALGEAYRGLLLTGRFPIAFLRLELPPSVVDVNVHPAKLEVRFQDGGRLYSQLLGAIRNKFLSTDLTAKVQLTKPTPEDEAAGAHDQRSAEQHRRELVDWAKGATENVPNAPGSRQAQLDYRFDRREDPLALPQRSAPHSHGFSAGNEDTATTTTFDSASSESAVAVTDRTTSTTATAKSSALQIHNRYLVTEDESGVVIIDQHALHERILYEQIREKVLAGQLETQRLLVPEPVTLPPAEAAAAIDARDLLRQLGMEVEPFGGDTVLISSYPAMLANISPAEMLRQAVDQLMAGGKQPDRRDILDELLHMISCKAAIKAGDKLTPEEVTALLEHRHMCQDSHHCPHGRPTALVFTREELDRRFQRT